jgi:periplasmic protein TonB
METKKSKKANIENWRSIFFTSGLAIVLGLLIVAFEWKSITPQVFETNTGTVIFDDDIIQITKRELPKPIAPPKMITDKINIVNNNTDIRDVVVLPTDYPDDIPYEFPDDIVTEFIEEWHKFPEIPAVFPYNLDKFLKDNTNYPEQAKMLNIQGIVYLNFQIDSKGKVKNVVVLRGVDPLLDEEAIRVVESMPPWTPAIQGDKKVGTEMGISIKFILRN